MKKWPFALAGAAMAIVAVAGAAFALTDSGDDGGDVSRVSRPSDENDNADTGDSGLAVCIEGVIDCDDTIVNPDGDSATDTDEPVSDQPPITIIDDQDPNECNLVHNITACEKAIVALAAENLTQRQANPGAITVESIEFVQWPDACLGVYEPDVACAEVITPGFKIVLRVNDQTFEYHTDGASRAVLVE